MSSQKILAEGLRHQDILKQTRVNKHVSHRSHTDRTLSKKIKRYVCTDLLTSGLEDGDSDRESLWCQVLSCDVTTTPYLEI